MATQKQIDANRRNASKSTGPRTEDGKNRSRGNALKHGLAGSGLVMPQDDAEAVRERAAEWNSSLKPFDPYEMWLLEVVAVESIRVDRCRVLDRVLRDEQVRRADTSRDGEQRQTADELASKLARDPSVAAKLRSTVAGASLLLERWRALSRALEKSDWTAAQEALALDMLGTPAALREGAASPFFVGPRGDARARRREVVGSEIGRLERLISEVLPARDADDRELAKAGVPDLGDPALVRLHRYESRCFRRLMWATQQMQSQHRVVTSPRDGEREPVFPRPPKEVELPPESPVEPPPKSAEPPVDRGRYLQDILSNRDLLDLDRRIRQDNPAWKGPSYSRTISQELLSEKDRPGRRKRGSTG